MSRAQFNNQTIPQRCVLKGRHNLCIYGFNKWNMVGSVIRKPYNLSTKILKNTKFRAGYQEMSCIVWR